MLGTPKKEKCECGGFIQYNFQVQRRQCKDCKKVFGKKIINKPLIQKPYAVGSPGIRPLGMFVFKDTSRKEVSEQ